jgi:hypothetical protein
MFLIAEEGLTPPHPPLPESLEILISDCLNHDPALRPTFAEIIVRLKRVGQLDPIEVSV